MHRTEPLDLSATTTVLSNGLRVASDPSPGHFASVGLFAAVGCRSESPAHIGCSHFLDRLAFRVHL